jgi:hypothetical protein
MRDWFVRLVFLGAMGAAVFWGWERFFPSPEHVIRKRLSELATAASISANEAPLTKLVKAQKLSSLFANDAQVVVDIPGRSIQTFNGRDEIQQAAIGVRAMLSPLKVEFVDVAVALAADKRSALAHLTATADLPGEKVPEVEELEIGLVKVERDWLINKIQTVKTLR